MQAVVFYLALPFIYAISALPRPLFYGLSNFLYFVLYRLIGYRKQVVLTNLRNSFPEKTEQEILQIADKFYRHLCDLMLETLQTLTFTKKQALKHGSFDQKTVELLNSYANKGQSIIVVLGHYGNWEWGGNCFAQQFNGTPYIIYHQLSNPYFDKLMYHMRTRFGTKLIEMKETYKQMLANRKEVTATAFIADQTPGPDNAYWTIFLNQPTPVFKGTEILAKKFNYPVIYITVNRLKRGYYQATGKLICENPKEKNDGEISEMHTRLLENDIFAYPEFWLWSHKRWKHKPNKDTLQQLIKNG